MYSPTIKKQLNEVCASLNNAKSILEDLGFKNKSLEIDAIELEIDNLINAKYLEDA
tara:strand:- start:469 stop:636 length:168 start_codon:yes stop_codon:yes gene_type:complete